MIVGLGNPGRRYENTRHNLGFQVIELLAKIYKKKLHKSRQDYDWARLSVNGEGLYLVKPRTFMNNSGLTVSDCLDRWGVASQELLVVCDDLSLPLGKSRIRAQGSDGGHNGLKSIISHVGTTDFPRLRMGIGQNPSGQPAEKFVLEPFEKREKKTVKEMTAQAAQAANFAVREGIEKGMNQFNNPGGQV